jgi:hypothetical protein
VGDELLTSLAHSPSVFLMRLISLIDVQLFHVWQLHDKRCQLRHLFQCVESCPKAIDSVDVTVVVTVTVAFDLFHSIVETDVCELLHFAQFFDTVVAKATTL